MIGGMSGHQWVCADPHVFFLLSEQDAVDFFYNIPPCQFERVYCLKEAPLEIRLVKSLSEAMEFFRTSLPSEPPK